MDSQSHVHSMSAALRHRRGIIATVLLLAVVLLFWYQLRIYSKPTPPANSPHHGGSSGSQWDRKRDGNTLIFNTQRCQSAFPGLFEEIDRAKRERTYRHISRNEIDSITPKNGYIRAMIYNQQLYIIHRNGTIYSREYATLQALNRAIVSSPDPLPNIEFVFNTDDKVDSVAQWGYARRPQDKDMWLMPDFGYWSWPETKVGTMQEVQTKAEQEEQTWTWPKKIPKLFWRGATMGLEVRDKLIEVTHGQPWADVKPIIWRDKDSMKNDLRSMPEHCEFKYLAQTEGNSYSGRLKYLQSCNSVVISHTLEWIQHQSPLMKSSGPEQNYVEVRRDWSDLHEKIQWLESHENDAKRIAQNNVKTFREHYLTPAAEVCYWRHLIRSWSEVSFKPEFYKEVNGKKVWRGLPVESFLLERRLEWEPY
ncbi:hypothetical protein McanMca71_003766 [Microsporum canis]|uniref:DUF821 domain-containing protein n=1 Tax=Arthroderma otae (strain ATCC MYA-4605 / CBS 113480) TaxID=554155 RepID=C5FT47_ARTOC|nr:DUF821 domain-containing protein [Microsporum canis CBS 113480]EEQ33050.1 DUF821 domain-containing protein [Microsporum canis CBS 113480]